jgi:hypothetical protein
MDRVVYSETATDLLVWRLDEPDIIVWDVEAEAVDLFSRIEGTVFIAERFDCCGPL